MKVNRVGILELGHSVKENEHKTMLYPVHSVPHGSHYNNEKPVVCCAALWNLDLVYLEIL